MLLTASASAAAQAAPAEVASVEKAVSRGDPRAESVPRLDSAAAQLAHAASLRSAMRGKEGDAKNASRRAAVEAYRAVREYFASDARACAEAGFRAGELLRSADDVAGALAEFQVAKERGADSPFRVRAELEIGHLHRRAQEYEKALSSYETVLADPSASAGQRDDASYWSGHVCAAEKRIDEARKAWQRVADHGEDPLDRIRAWDCIAQSYVDAGDLEAAAGAIEKCHEALAEVSAEETKLGERVRNAITSMRAVDELQRAVEKRDKVKSAAKKGDAGANRDGGEKKN
jgi:tetratricopeptide (TPR) repeat protein